MKIFYLLSLFLAYLFAPEFRDILWVNILVSMWFGHAVMMLYYWTKGVK